MSQLGSLQNVLMDGSRSKPPVVADGATLLYWSDREPCTVVAVSPSGKTITLREDRAVRLDSNGMSESQEYRFEQDPAGHVFKARLNKRGKWKTPDGVTVLVGHRSKYYDFSF